MRHAEGGGKEGVAVEDMEDGIALRGRVADSGGLDAVATAGVICFIQLPTTGCIRHYTQGIMIIIILKAFPPRSSSSSP